MSLTVPLYGFGGGGESLNFKVVGDTTEPTNPNENTIWVNTDKKIASWIFSATQPKTATEGMVWIFTGTFSAVEFNALKKNGIQVYPISAKQYVGGAWVDKVAKSYQSGKWVDWWNGELYQNGNEYSFLTGGWSGTGLAKSENELVISGSSSRKGIAYTNSVVDLTKYKTIEVTASCTITSDDTAGAIIITTDQTSLNSDDGVLAKYVFSPIGVHTDKVFSLAIPSGLPSKYYIKLFWYSQRSEYTMKVSKVQLK